MSDPLVAIFIAGVAIYALLLWWTLLSAESLRKFLAWIEFARDWLTTRRRG